MKKQYEEFQKMKVKEMCRAIQDMTYTYLNPESQLPTVVPAKHYEKILNETIEQFIVDSLKVEMLNNVYKQLNLLLQEYERDVIKSILCIDQGIKPNDMSIPEQIALDGTVDYILEKKEKEKKKFHFLDQEFLDKFDNLLNDRNLHAQVISSQDECDMEDEDLEDENELTFS